MRNPLFWFLLLLPILATAQPTAIDSLAMYHEATALNSGKIQQEMIYLHLDNTSYYRGDRIFFAGYLVRSGDLKPSGLSRTVYVELLNPNGKVIDRCVLKTVGGRFHGSLLVEEKPFYSGYYEVRAYTRYMLSFGAETAFSRIIPVFGTPAEEGDWAERKMLEYGSPKLEFNRPKPRKTKEVNVKFYPEGGRLVNGLTATVAFEITDSQGRPLAAEGQLVCGDKSEVATFKSGHMGRGVLQFTPVANRKYKAEFLIDGKRYRVDLPKIVPQGITLTVDNLSDPDSAKVTVHCTPDFPHKVVGASLACRNEICGRFMIDLQESDSTTFSVPLAKMPTGVIVLTLFGTSGSVLTDRMFFNNRRDFVEINYEFNKSEYAPLEQVEMTVQLKDSLNPVPYIGHLSLSVTDAAERVVYGSNILSELLLSSEIRGYVHNPAWYFADASDPERREALDRLLMVQGWRRYSWRRLAGMEEFRVDSVPEKGIEVHGQVLERWRNKPVKGVTVSAMLTKPETDSTKQKTTHIDTFTTDTNGRFSFLSYIKGKHLMTLSVAKKNKLKPYRIILDANENPGIRVYEPGEMQVVIDNSQAESIDSENKSNERPDSVYVPGKGKMLKEVTVTGQAMPRKLWQVIENAAASYDIEASHNALFDNGKKFIRTLADILPMIDGHFSYNKEFTYNGKRVIFVFQSNLGNNKKALKGTFGFMDPKEWPVEMIKNVYVSTDRKDITELIWRLAANEPLGVKEAIRRKTGCVVYVEVHEKLGAKPRQGTRRTTLDGYTKLVEFYSPDYSSKHPVDADYRRTLYWNPDVVVDSAGAAKVRFFNNSTARRFHVSTATVTPAGTLGGK